MEFVSFTFPVKYASHPKVTLSVPDLSEDTSYCIMIFTVNRKSVPITEVVALMKNFKFAMIEVRSSLASFTIKSLPDICFSIIWNI